MQTQSGRKTSLRISALVTHTAYIQQAWLNYRRWRNDTQSPILSCRPKILVKLYDYWWRASIRDGRAAEAVLRRYLPFWWDMKHNRTVEFGEFLHIGYDGWNKFIEPKFFPGFGVPHFGLLIYIVSFVTGKAHRNVRIPSILLQSIF